MDGELNLVALADVQCLPDRIRQGELRLLAKSRSSVGPRSQFVLGISLVQGAPPAFRYLDSPTFPTNTGQERGCYAAL